MGTQRKVMNYDRCLQLLLARDSHSFQLLKLGKDSSASSTRVQGGLPKCSFCAETLPEHSPCPAPTTDLDTVHVTRLRQPFFGYECN